MLLHNNKKSSQNQCDYTLNDKDGVAEIVLSFNKLPAHCGECPLYIDNAEFDEDAGFGSGIVHSCPFGCETYGCLVKRPPDCPIVRKEKPEPKSKETESGNAISVDTSFGRLEACVGGDPGDYPEIFTYLVRPDGVEIDLVAVGVKDKLPECLVRAYLYGNTATEEYTRTHDWTASEINISVD